MKNKKPFWITLLILGICPIAFPFVTYLYQTLLSKTWTLLDWLIMYSYLYWPTYLIGILLIAFSTVQLVREKKRKHN